MTAPITAKSISTLAIDATTGDHSRAGEIAQAIGRGHTATVSTWEAALATGYNDQTIRNLIRKGKLRAERGVDGRYRLDPNQIAKVAEAKQLLSQALSS